MSAASQKRSEEFLKIAGQFKLGALVTESSHPVTANLSEVAKNDIAAALDLLFQVDEDVVNKFREFAESGQADKIKVEVLRALKNGGRIFFTGCGSTGRLSILLDSIWRDFWQQQTKSGKRKAESENNFEDRTFSVMAGGDYALIKSVEGFEDFAAFGKKQIADLDVSNKDVVFAITEGGETSFVIGTAWQGVEVGAKVYFVYNNPDDILCEHVERSREVIQDPRIEKINLTTGPMAITGSTRMQATSIELCVMLTVMEMVVCELVNEGKTSRCYPTTAIAQIPSAFCKDLNRLLSGLRKPAFRDQLAALVLLEETTYRTGQRVNYFSEQFALDVLSDTTERSPTYCTPPFRKFDDTTASESWAFLLHPESATPTAWKRLLRRTPRCIDWSENDVRSLVGADKFHQTWGLLKRIRYDELMRFRIGRDGLSNRGVGKGDAAVAILSGYEATKLVDADGFICQQLDAARDVGAQTGFLRIGGVFHAGRGFMAKWNSECVSAFAPVPSNRFPLQSITRIAVKLVMNALSTCTMVRLGRVMGNYMVWVVPSNLKLIDRATRYIEKLTGLDYDRANQLLFEVIEYIEPRMKADQAYPPVVGMAVLRARHNLTNEEAELRLAADSDRRS